MMARNIGFFNWGPKPVDHFLDRRFPFRLIHKGRVHLDVVEAVARHAVRLDQILPGPSLSVRLVLAGGSPGMARIRPASTMNDSHRLFPFQATTMVTTWMALW